MQAFERRPRCASNLGSSAGVRSQGPSRAQRDAPVSGLPPECTPLHLNLLLVGRQGVGKSTFMLNACARWGMAPRDLPTNDEADAVAMATFETQPDSMACSLPEILLGADEAATARTCKEQSQRQQLRALRIRFQDTPGYGDRDCRGPERPSRHLPAVLRWVLRQRHRDLAALNGAALSVADGGRRLGVLPYSSCLCIFMVDPHRFTALDVEYLWALSRVVGVLPVLARADTLTAHERQQLRERVVEALAGRKGVRGLAEPVPTYRFSAQALDAMGQAALPIPHILSVMGSPDMAFMIIAGYAEDQTPKESRQQQRRQRQQQQQQCQQHEQHALEEDGGDGVWVPADSSNSGSPPPAAAPAAAGRWVAVRRLCGDCGVVLSAADPSLSDTELLLGLLRADLWGVAADARDRHIDFADRFKAAGRRLSYLERDLLRHVAWRRLGATRPSGAAGTTFVPPVPAAPYDPYGCVHVDQSGIFITQAHVTWLAMLGLAAVVLYLWVHTQPQREAGSQLAVVSRQQEEYLKAMHRMQDTVAWLRSGVESRDQMIRHLQEEVRFLEDRNRGCAIS